MLESRNPSDHLNAGHTVLYYTGSTVYHRYPVHGTDPAGEDDPGILVNPDHRECYSDETHWSEARCETCDREMHYSDVIWQDDSPIGRLIEAIDTHTRDYALSVEPASGTSEQVRWYEDREESLLAIAEAAQAARPYLKEDIP